jgi:hypothetical protein
MTQKNETPAQSKAVTETKTTTAKPEKAPVTPSEPAIKRPSSGRGSTGNLPPEVVELVTELRDTVKRLDPRKHTVKTLRRALFNVRDILADIEALDPES